MASSEGPARPSSPPGTHIDQETWSALAQAARSHDVARPWLAIQCGMIPGTARGIVVLGEPDSGPFEAVADWPAGAPAGDGLASAATAALEQRQPIVRRSRVEAGSPGGGKNHAAARGVAF